MGEQQQQQRADARRRQRRENGQRMHVALVKHAQHDIDRRQRRHDQPGHGGRQLAEGGGGAGKTGLDAGGQTELRHRLLDQRLRLLQRNAVVEVKGDGAGGRLSLMRHRQRRVAAAQSGEGGERHPIAAVVNHIELLQNRRVARVAAVKRHHDVILIQRVIERGDLTLAEGVIEHGVEHLHIDAEARGAIAIDSDHHLLAAGLRVGVDAVELRDRRQRRLYFRRPGAQQIEIVRLQAVLIAGVGAAAADMQILRCHQEHLRAGDMAGFHAQPVGHFGGGGVALVEILQPHEEVGAVARAEHAAAHRGHNALYRRIGLNNVGEYQHFRLHRLKRDVLVGAQRAHQQAGVLIGKEALLHHAVKKQIEQHGKRQAEHRELLMAHHPVQPARIGGQQRVEPVLDKLIDRMRPGGDPRPALQQP